MERLRRHAAVIVLGIAAVLLPLGIWGPGLWDPWEMNRTFLARKMAEAPLVLVAESRARGDSAALSSPLADALGEDATVVSTVDAGGIGGAVEATRSQVSDRVYRVVVLDVDARMKSTDDADGAKALADTLKALAPQNLSTRFVLVSGGGQGDPAAVLARLETDADDATDTVSAATRADLADAVRGLLSGDAFLAQFKSSGRTAFQPPLDPYLVSLSLRAFGMNEFAARLPGTVMAILVLVLVFVAVRRAFGDPEAMLAVVVLATAPLFFTSARFVANQLTVVLGLGLGTVALGALVTDRARTLPALAVLAGAFLVQFLAGGMTAVVTLLAIVAAWPLIALDRRPKVLAAAGLALALGGLAALLTFVPDGAFWRQFRFTSATFAGGMNSEARSFDFVWKEIGFGMFPWSALLPLSVLAVVGTGDRPRPERLLALLWAVAPLVVLMVTVRPMYHTLYAGLPALAVLNAVYLRELEDDRLESRLLAFFAFGLFLVIMKDVMRSPAPLVSYLTTDPMFSESGKGDLVFPPMKLPGLAKLFIVLGAFALIVSGGRLVSAMRRITELLSRGRAFLWVMVALGGLVLADWIIFLALKWETVTSADPDAAVGSVLLRIFLTGPDVLALYGAVLFVLGARYHQALGRALRRVFPARWLERAGAWAVGLENPRATGGLLAIAAVGLVLVLGFRVVPELSYHLSQKHILETWKESSETAPGDLYRHGVFAGRGSEDSNFYTGQVKDMTARTEVVDRLKDASRRTFFIFPKNQWSELNSAVRQANSGRSVPVLDERSSRFILVASSLAAGETDHNWLADATLTQAQFDAMTDVVRETASFDDKIQLVGFQLDKQAVRRGGTVQMKLFFKAVEKVPVSYRMFLHVDRVGSSSRIHGDHWILNLVKETEDQTSCVGCFATTHWLKGDIVVDTYNIEVPIGSPSGPHDIWMGFYSPGDDKRLPIKEFDKAKIRHDGQNRIRVGSMTVE